MGDIAVEALASNPSPTSQSEDKVTVFTKGLIAHFEQRRSMVELFDEIPKHKNTKSLYRSPVFQNVDLLAVLQATQRDETEMFESKNKAKFLGAKVGDFFVKQQSATTDWL